jgi:hypothetical protein
MAFANVQNYCTLRLVSVRSGRYFFLYFPEESKKISALKRRTEPLKIVLPKNWVWPGLPDGVIFLYQKYRL